MHGVDDVLYALPDSLARKICALPDNIKKDVCEIRLRINSPVALTMTDRTLFLSDSGISNRYYVNLPLCTSSDLSECLMRMCERSLHTYETQLAQGYIILRSGSRAGVCGRYAFGRVSSVRDVTSINIRVPHEVTGCAAFIVDRLGTPPRSALICGAPGSGKTTLLRDIARSYSMRLVRVCVSDERGEIAARFCDSNAFDLGPCCDVMSGCDKMRSFEMLLRTMNPQLLIFDEIGTGDNPELIRLSLESGVPVIASMHSRGEAQTISRLQSAKLDGVFEYIVLLNDRVGDIGEVKRIA